MRLTSLAAAETFITDQRFSFIYVSRTNCGVCHALLPQLQQMLQAFPLIQLGYVDADELEAIAGHFSIFTVPALLLFVDGKEMIREARFVRMQLLEEKISKLYKMVIGE